MGLDTIANPLLKERTDFPLESSSTALGVPVAIANLTVLTPGTIGNVPEDEPTLKDNVYVPVEKTTQ